MELVSAQDQLDSAAPNSRVVLTGGDCGPLVIAQPVTLDCNGASVWAGRDMPAIRIRARDVVIENAVLRAEEKTADGSWPLVLEIEANASAQFRNVKLAGAIRGCGAESGPWIIPAQFDLGIIATSTAYFSLELAVPVPCRLISRVQGVDFDPPALAPGVNVVHMKVADVPRDTILWGMAELSSEQFVRLLPLHGRVAIATPGTAGQPVKLHQLTKKQAGAFNQELHPAPPVSTPPVAALPRESAPGAPAKKSKAKGARKGEAVAEKKPETPTPPRAVPAPFPPIAPAAESAPAPGVEKTPSVLGSPLALDSISTRVSSIFLRAEPEFPVLIVQPHLHAAMVRATLFEQASATHAAVPTPPPSTMLPREQVSDADASTPDEKTKDPDALKTEPKKCAAKPLISNLFRPTEP